MNKIPSPLFPFFQSLWVSLHLKHARNGCGAVVSAEGDRGRYRGGQGDNASSKSLHSQHAGRGCGALVSAGGDRWRCGGGAGDKKGGVSVYLTYSVSPYLQHAGRGCHRLVSAGGDRWRCRGGQQGGGGQEKGALAFTWTTLVAVARGLLLPLLTLGVHAVIIPSAPAGVQL